MRFILSIPWWDCYFLSHLPRTFLHFPLSPEPGRSVHEHSEELLLPREVQTQCQQKHPRCSHQIVSHRTLYFKHLFKPSRELWNSSGEIFCYCLTHPHRPQKGFIIPSFSTQCFKTLEIFFLTPLICFFLKTLQPPPSALSATRRNFLFLF